VVETAQASAETAQSRPARRIGYGSAFLIALLLIAVLGVGVQAVSDLDKFAKVTLNGLTLSGIYFIVASGFTLIFGLMRIVNMAQGSFYMLAGIMAFLIQERMLGDEAGSGFGPPQATLAQYLVPLVIATLSVAILGLIIQQAFLRWNQGQELRQALITIALSIIIADQAVARFGGIAKEIAIPVGQSVKLPWIGSYGSMRLIVMGVAILVGILLFLLITRTRFGMNVRAGVDDRQMASALGVNIQVIFAAGFFLGAALAGLAGVLGASVISVNKADDGKFLLISLIVVIIGGMGSLIGAAIGALLLGLIDSYGDVYLPSGFSNYSVILTFLLLVVILAVRPYGLFGRPGSG
jgi:branched-chain amino acid transport system permease protein